MKMLKEDILRWNNQDFKNIFKEKLEIEDRLKELNLEVIKYCKNDNCILEKELLAKKEDILTKEKKIWRQKSWERWLEERDRNTKYFYNLTIYNKSKSMIKSIRNQDGIAIDKPTKIAEIFIKHF